MDIGIFIILLAIGIFIITLWIMIGALWQLIRRFFHKNYSYFDTSFIVAYFLEQFMLIFLFFKYPEYSEFQVSIFALFVVTTASLQKLMMESRNRRLSKLTDKYFNLSNDLYKLNDEIIEENKFLENENKEIINYVKKLNKK